MKTIAIAGLGAIGYAVARGIERSSGMRLASVSVRDAEAARSRLDTLAQPVQLVALSRIADDADIVIECGGAAVLHHIAAPVLRAGKQLLVLSAGTLLVSPDLLALAEQYRSQVHIPSGAIGGLDAVAAMAQGEIRSVRLVTTKPPAAMRNIAWLAGQGIDPDRVKQPTRVFAGSASEAVRCFPANLNVAAALAMAGIGAGRTMVELWIDPALRGNRHVIEVDAVSGIMHFSMEAVPSVNPATSSLAAQSVLAMLHRMT